MSNYSKSATCRRRLVFALLLGALPMAESRAAQRPATPCPCTADGACYPQGPWGFTGTKWRPWPGDVISKAETPAEEAEARERLQLEPYELPPPEKEGERGPVRTRRPKAPRDEAGAGDLENEAPEPAVPLPDNVQLPGDVPLPGEIPLPGEPQGGVANPDDFGVEPPAAELEQPPAAAPAEETPVPQESPSPEEPEPAEPQEDFDPFSQVDEPRPLPTRAKVNAVRVGGPDAPPALPPSLRKLSKTVSVAQPVSMHGSRFVHAAAIVE